MEIEQLIEAYADENGDVPPEIMLSIASGAITEPPAKETDEITTESSTVEVEEEQEPEKKEEIVEEPEKVIVTRDGKHTIPYSELADTRNELKEANKTIAELQAKLQHEVDGLKEQLAKAQKSDEETGTTEATDALMEELEDLDSDYPGASKLIAKLQAQVKSLQEAKEAEARAMEQADAERKALEEFNAAATAKEPRFMEATMSKEFWQWLDSQPKYVQAARNTGDPETAAELVTAFYNATEKPAPASDKGGKEPVIDKAKVADAVKKAEEKPVVNSLSDIPGGGNADYDELNGDPDAMAIFKKLQGLSEAEARKRLERYI